MRTDARWRAAVAALRRSRSSSRLSGCSGCGGGGAASAASALHACRARRRAAPGCVARARLVLNGRAAAARAGAGAAAGAGGGQAAEGRRQRAAPTGGANALSRIGSDMRRILGRGPRTSYGLASREALPPPAARECAALRPRRKGPEARHHGPRVARSLPRGAQRTCARAPPRAAARGPRVRGPPAPVAAFTVDFGCCAALPCVVRSLTPAPPPSPQMPPGCEL